MTDPVPARLRAEALTLRYGERTVAEHLSLSLPDAGFTAIVGPNACGKSTLLRALARLLTPASGTVILDGQAIAALPSRHVARRLALLPQTALAPDGITVLDLVARGRYPHQSWLRQWSQADEMAVTQALNRTGTADLADRPVAELSGGQRQRVWLATVLAQDTPILLLDEPTTFLDIAHQIELLDLLAELNEQGRTVVAVLHDLNQAARYASHLVAMKAGTIVAQGPPVDIVTPDLVHAVFGIPARVLPDPVTGTPMIVPERRRWPATAPAARSAADPAERSLTPCT